MTRHEELVTGMPGRNSRPAVRENAPFSAFGKSGDGRGLIERMGEPAGASPCVMDMPQGKASPSISGRAKKWAAAALASVSLAVAGCGDTNEYNYYIIPANPVADAEAEGDAAAPDSGPDSDIGPDADVPDADSDAVPDADSADAESDAELDSGPCVPDLAPLSCDSSSPIAEGVISNTQTLEAGNIVFALNSVELHDTETFAIIDVLDNCGNILKRERRSEGGSVEIGIAGVSYSVEVRSVYQSDTDPWALLSVSIDCTDGTGCVMAQGVINRGEILLADDGQRGVRLDDLMASGTPAAIVSLVDMTMGEPLTLASYVIHESESAETAYGFSIRVNTVALGASYAAMWADLSLIPATCE